MATEEKRPRLGPPGPSIVDQAATGSGAATQLVHDVTLWGDHVASVVYRMQTAVLYGVDVEEGGLRNLTEEDSGALVGALRTLQQLVAGVDQAAAVILGQPELATMPHDEWPVSL